jgi:flagellar biosynthesis/type III secretory pathway protein FliH
MSDVVPFLSAIAAHAAPRPAPSAFGAALPVAQVPVGTSPWSPQPPPPPPVAALPAIDLESLKSEARETGRREGLAETDALRTKLAALCAQLETKLAAVSADTVEIVAESASTVVEAFVGATDQKRLFAPVVQQWLAAARGPATACVHPADIAAMTETIGDAPLTVVGDESVARGDVVIRGAAYEIEHRWDEHFQALRHGIAAALAVGA